MDVSVLGRDAWVTLRWIRLESLRDSPAAFVGRWNAERNKRHSYWDSQFDRKTWVVARDDAETVVGVAALVQTEADEWRARFVESVWVAPLHRKRHVLGQMLELVEKTALNDGVPQLRLWVLDTNKSVEQVYTRLGFTPVVGRIQDTAKSLPDGTRVREHLMIKPLSEESHG